MTPLSALVREVRVSAFRLERAARCLALWEAASLGGFFGCKQQSLSRLKRHLYSCGVEDV
eukprot:5035977-Amphidinium_carterae.1